MGPLPSNVTPGTSVPTNDLDLSTVVGHDLTIYSKQFPGKPLKSRITLVTENTFSVDRGGADGQIDSLVNNQRVTIKLDYKGQPISIAATLKRSSGGRCNIQIDEKVTLLARRRFTRITLARPAKFAVVPSLQTPVGRLPKLRWIPTETRDVSSGGVLVQTSSSLEENSYVLLSIDLEDFPLPSLVVGQVRYTYPTDSGKIATGIEFIVREDKEKHATSGVMSRLPAVVFEYNRDLRHHVEERLRAWMHKNNKPQSARSMDS